MNETKDLTAGTIPVDGLPHLDAADSSVAGTDLLGRV